MPKNFFDRPFCLLCLAAAHAAYSLFRLGELHVKAGCVNPSSRVAQFTGAPSHYVNGQTREIAFCFSIFLTPEVVDTGNVESDI